MNPTPIRIPRTQLPHKYNNKLILPYPSGLIAQIKLKEEVIHG